MQFLFNPCFLENLATTLLTWLKVAILFITPLNVIQIFKRLEITGNVTDVKYGKVVKF